MTQTRLLFDKDARRPSAETRVLAPRLPVGERAPGWRSPTRGEHVCSGCAGAACYGVGEAWFCRACAPADFLPPESRP